MSTRETSFQQVPVVWSIFSRCNARMLTRVSRMCKRWWQESLRFKTEAQLEMQCRSGLYNPRRLLGLVQHAQRAGLFRQTKQYTLSGEDLAPVPHNPPPDLRDQLVYMALVRHNHALMDLLLTPGGLHVSFYKMWLSYGMDYRCVVCVERCGCVLQSYTPDLSFAAQLRFDCFDAAKRFDEDFQLIVACIVRRFPSILQYQGLRIPQNLVNAWCNRPILPACAPALLREILKHSSTVMRDINVQWLWNHERSHVPVNAQMFHVCWTYMSHEARREWLQLFHRMQRHFPASERMRLLNYMNVEGYCESGLEELHLDAVLDRAIADC